VKQLVDLRDTRRHSESFGMQVGRYRTPGGADIDRTGILPDFKSPLSPEVAAARLRACAPPPRA
jgi:C-terminal processing protease CtpA/Prc